MCRVSGIKQRISVGCVRKIAKILASLAYGVNSTLLSEVPLENKRQMSGLMIISIGALLSRLSVQFSLVKNCRV